MSSSMRGIDTSASEVTNITQHGFWVLVEEREYFIPFSDYPVFRQATIAQIYAVQRISDDQLHWPELDADVELEALERPHAYPLTYRP